MSTESENAVVTTTLSDGSVVGREECKPDDYVIVLGPDCHISHVQSYPGTRTVQLTIKRGRAA